MENQNDTLQEYHGKTKIDVLSEEVDLFNGKYMKKYIFSIGVMGIGLFIGGAITPGIFAGLFAAAGTALSIDRLRETWPEAYNWMIDHPGWVEILTTVVFAGAFGFTATGLVGGLVANILSSVVIDYYTDKEGRVVGVKTITFGDLLRGLVSSIKSFFITTKAEVKAIIQENRNQSLPDIKVNAEIIDVEAQIIEPQAA